MADTQITFRHMSASDSLRELIQEKLEKLMTRFPDACDCHVVVDCAPPTKHRQGDLYLARVELTIGRAHLRIAAEASNEDAYVGMREAFQNLARQIEHRVQRRAS